MPKAKSAAAKALEVDDHLAEAPASLGYASFTPFILSTSVLSVVMKKPWRWRERGSGALWACLDTRMLGQASETRRYE